VGCNYGRGRGCIERIAQLHSGEGGVAQRQAGGGGGLSCDWRKGMTCWDGLDRLLGSNASTGSIAGNIWATK
jgi:hypothetical protein